MDAEKIKQLAIASGFDTRGRNIVAKHSNGAWVLLDFKLSLFAKAVEAEVLNKLNAA